MSTIRPLDRSDLAAVADLYEMVVRSGSAPAPPGLSQYFARTLLDNPWVDPELPSLVQLDGHGSIVAFQGSNVRRATFDGQPIRIACAGQLISHPQARAGGAGARLMATYMRGPQDLTITDGATEEMRKIWTMLGGQMAHLQCVGWIRMMRPARFLRHELSRHRRPPHEASPRRAPRQRKPTLLPLPPVRAAGRWRPFVFPARAAAVASEPLTPAALLENLPAWSAGARLRPAYDELFLQWLFAELAAVNSRGTLVARLVRDRHDRRALGSYVYYLQPGGTSHVLQLLARERDVGAVLDDLLAHAWTGRSAAVRGRVEPHLLEPLARRRCLMHYGGMALVHSAQPEILGAIGSGRSILSRIDGEWWMGHHVLDFGPSPPTLLRAAIR
jgi:hypothetical protein